MGYLYLYLFLYCCHWLKSLPMQTYWCCHCMVDALNAVHYWTAVVVTVTPVLSLTSSITSPTWLDSPTTRSVGCFYFIYSVADTTFLSVQSRLSNHIFRLCVLVFVPSVLWRCWLGGRKGIRPVKNWVVGCWHGYLSGARCRLAYGPADSTATHCLLLQ